MENQTTWWQGIIIGASGGFAVWLTGILREQFLKWLDKKTVYSCLKKKIEDGEKGYTFISTLEISTYTNLTEERVNYICSIHKKNSTVSSPSGRDDLDNKG